jgi:hypothetical protein
MSPKPESSTRLLADLVRKHVTSHNVLMLLVLLFQGGQLWERQQVTNHDIGTAVSALEVRLQAAEATAIATYVRRDVLDVTLRSMDARLTAIESLLRDRRD